MTRNASACGKIILSGEYAVLFGYAGIAIPSLLHIHASMEDGEDTIIWNAPAPWIEFAQDILHRTGTQGTLTITSDIPLGKGMGASTALVIAICRAVLGPNCRSAALAIEDAVNPGHSGIDFAVIWNERPVLFRKGEEPKEITLQQNLLNLGYSLIDTGTPDQQTPELIAWVKKRHKEEAVMVSPTNHDSTPPSLVELGMTVHAAIATIGQCTQRLINNEPLAEIIRDHHKAQCALGIVTDKAKSLITKIEQEGGAAKVIGAGSRTGGCGMVFAVGVKETVIESITKLV